MRFVVLLGLGLFSSLATMSAQSGITLIVHGFTPPVPQPNGTLKAFIGENWQDFANGIKPRKGNNAVIYKNDPVSGVWKEFSGTGTSNPTINSQTEIILVFDWADVSWILKKGYG